MTFLPFLIYLEKMIDEIRLEPKPDGRLNPEQIYTLCLYKREKNRLQHEKNSSNDNHSTSRA
jgi:hypothetical protein